MTNQSENLNTSLFQLSELIRETVANESRPIKEIQELETWLLQQLDKIRVSKLDAVVEYPTIELQENKKQDSIWVLNSEFEILHFGGMHGLLEQKYSQLESRLFVRDILEEEDFKRFQACFREALDKNTTQEIDVNLKSNQGEIGNCKLVVEMKLSNPSEDRFIVFIRCPSNPLVYLENYQSVIFENMPEIDIYLFDKEYRYLFAAGGEKKRFNFTNIDFVGKTIFEAYDRKTVRSIYPFYNKILNGEKTEGEVRFRDEIYYLVGSPLKDAEGKTVAGILIAQNVTNDKLIEEQLRKSREEAEKANQAKSIFIANMSHEIRTPLNAIVGFSNQLAKTDLNGDQRRLVRLVQNASDHLMYLVGEVVFLFKLGMGKVYLEKVPFSLMDILSELQVMFEAQAIENRLDFEFECDDQLPEALIGDPFRLRQILMNLLVNAIKYTEAGKVIFRCKLKKNLKRRVELRFEVEDTGIGISAKDLSNIFNVFEQGSASTPGRRTGAGLGLGICKRLVEMLKGEIKVKSKVGVGSTFIVELPFEKANRESLPKDSKEFSMEDKNLKGKRILIADDDDHNLLLAEMIMTGWETDLTMARDGGEALALLESREFDAILLDIHMPEMTGVDLIKKIRSSGKQLNHKTPAMAVTANALHSDLAKYLKAGFDDYLIKPYKETDLYNKICNALGIDAKLTTRKAKKVEAVQAALQADELDMSELEATAAGDQEFIGMMIKNFQGNAKALMERLERELADQNFDGVGEAAHKAIPSFKFFKLNGIVERLQKLEDLALRVRNFKDIPCLVDETLAAVRKVDQEIDLKFTKS
ncbi:hybrid sensor histidine kinase/response regulator [Mangrovibacterium diazotrophicum]|uniref:histidine kinase n=1 Tax=Mangrovibacterium diazotrophicum TaxID=1261403 RepID=A0A419W6L6_9BACT|nr:ATP-binding protein [Mangrovibacterium diazotrophicum]RKD91108.1 signal transduction histidine kinase [Mangrovibacterium diazotrophicum]